ncbi:hypothetical protein K1720_09250 [Thermococcus argininiproducens]|uniref:Uncharacterized protein n=1 Tax=Thermococcus argininiproducens TaxID=2866384 RepID=A0A9E7M9T7_9EURY|nr:hypothetical protein [Thermococcus argininiproducens]USG99673.1 hypothetical protein K1720_09250 [Thermococcus argininiproducens]
MIDLLGYILDSIVIVLGGLLSVVAWKAYKKSGMKSILLLLLAFLMFTIKKIIENFHLLNGTVSLDIIDITSTTLELGILLLFFVALVKRD